MIGRSVFRGEMWRKTRRRRQVSWSRSAEKTGADNRHRRQLLLTTELTDWLTDGHTLVSSSAAPTPRPAAPARPPPTAHGRPLPPAAQRPPLPRTTHQASPHGSRGTIMLVTVQPSQRHHERRQRLRSSPLLLGTRQVFSCQSSLFVDTFIN